MSLKDNVDFVKKELDTEEKFLESFVKVERFYKKNKKYLMALVSLLVILLAGYSFKNYINAKNKTESNIAFTQFLNDNNDVAALATLKDTNIRLYNVALYLKSKNETITEPINDKYLGTLVEYKKAIEENNIDQLNTLSMQKDFLLKEFSLFNKALILTQDGKYDEAKKSLQLIQKDSQVSDLVALLNHYLLTK
jgi:predicted negative regulator of RcsB-dependent stress response